MPQTSLHQFALSLIPQTNYVTPLVPNPPNAPKNYEQVIREGYGLTELLKTVATNAGQSTGTANPTESEIDKFDFPFSIPNERMTAQKLGRRLTAAMGLPVTTPVAGSSGAFRHIWKPLNPQLEGVLPVYTYVEKSDEPADSADITHDTMYPSASIETLNFSSGSQNAYLLGNSSWRGSGKAIDPSAVKFGAGGNVRLSAEMNESSIKSAQAIVSLFQEPAFGTTFPASNPGCGFRNVQIVYGTGLDAGSGYGCPKFQNQSDPNSGAVRGEIGYGNPTIELNFSLIKTRAFAQAFNPRDKFRKDAKFSALFDYVGGAIPGVTGTPINFEAKFKYPKLTISSIAFADENGKDSYDIKTLPISLGNEFAFEVEVVNNVASYAILT